MKIRPRQRMQLVALSFMLAALLAAGCTDRDIERTLGKQTAAAIESSYRVVDDPLVASYVNTMGHILVGHSKRQDIPYRFKVIETDVVNAAAVPWGYVYLTTGLLDFVESEDELWAVTGHEIGHQVGRDSVKAVKEDLLLSLATVLIGRETRLGGEIAELGFGLLSMKHSRDDEYQADDYGVEVTYAAGYDPTAHRDFFARLMEEIEKGHPSRLETLFLTHPPSKARIKRQDEKPEVAMADAEVLTQVAAGYARRGLYSEAIERLRTAVDLQPDSASARLLLGDCYLARGDRELAGTEYAGVLGMDESQVAAQEGLRLAKAPRAVSSPPPATDGEVAAAQAALQQATQRTDAAVEATASVTEELNTALVPVSRTVRESTQLIVAVGEAPRDLPPPAQQLAADAGLAIAQSNESAYGLERMSELVDEVGTSLTRTMTRAQSSCCAAPSAIEAGILARSSREAARCADELEALAARVPDLVKTTENASRVSQSAARRLQQALGPGSMLSDRQIAVDAIKLSRQRGEKARDQVREAAGRVVLARTRSLVAEINVAGVALGPQRSKASDDLVAYYTQSDTQDVRSLREGNGLGLGEAALVLAAAKSSQRPPEALVSGADESLQIVDAAESAGAKLRYVNLFLRFIANALADETEVS
jgi:predicted Zn-dependent protease